MSGVKKKINLFMYLIVLVSYSLVDSLLFENSLILAIISIFVIYIQF